MSWGTFFSIPTTATIWDIANSNALAALLGAYLTYSLTSLRATAESAKETANLAKETAEDTKNLQDLDVTVQEEATQVIQQSAFKEGDRNCREETAALIMRAKEFLNEKVKKDNDGRHQRTYSKISGNRPSLLAAALEERKQLSPEQMKAAIDIFTIWSPYWKGLAAIKPVPQSAFDAIKANYKILLSNNANGAGL